eukprot:GHVR01049562.1.p1 GENE.GHVR01049562.1~~GHVR01049562.1.p1  ORF type:complete len:536 (-),score=115.29 GHVR01049562.1:347-1954(-)
MSNHATMDLRIGKENEREYKSTKDNVIDKVKDFFRSNSNDGGASIGCRIVASPSDDKLLDFTVTSKTDPEDIINLLLEKDVPNARKLCERTILQTTTMSGCKSETLDTLENNISRVQLVLSSGESDNARRVFVLPVSLSNMKEYRIASLQKELKHSKEETRRVLEFLTNTATSDPKAGSLLLFKACACAHGVPVLQSLLQKDPSLINAKNDDGNLPIHVASSRCNQRVVNYLLDYGADNKAKGKLSRTPFLVSCFYGHLEMASFLYDVASPYIEDVDDNGNTALHLACVGGHVDVIEYLIEKGANIHAVGFVKRRCLHKASFTGHLEVVQLLLEKGAHKDLEEPDEDGNTALQLACGGGRLEVVEELLRHRANPLAVGLLDRTALHMACRNDHVDVATLLLDRTKIDINARDEDGNTALHLGASKGYVDVCALTLERHADANARGKAQRTPMHMVCQAGHLQVLFLLLDKGATDLELTDRDGRTALHLAAASGHLNVVRVLVQKGASVTAKGKKGKTPLDLCNDADVLTFLKQLM